MINIVRIVMVVVLIGLLMGKGIMDAIVHITAWVMTKLTERDTFKMSMELDYDEYFARHMGEEDIEH